MKIIINFLFILLSKSYIINLKLYSNKFYSNKHYLSNLKLNTNPFNNKYYDK